MFTPSVVIDGMAIGGSRDDAASDATTEREAR